MLNNLIEEVLINCIKEDFLDDPLYIDKDINKDKLKLASYTIKKLGKGSFYLCNFYDSDTYSQHSFFISDISVHKKMIDKRDIRINDLLK